MKDDLTATATISSSEETRVVSKQRKLALAYLSLTKPEITFLVTISAFAGFLIASPNDLDGFLLAATLTGIALCSAGAASLNHAREWRFDSIMKRTAKRPVPTGTISVRRASMFGYILSAAGIGLLCPVVNPITAVLAGLTIVLYVYVYTPLKRKTTLNTLVGTLPGALPALGGYTAVTGRIDLAALPLFLILLFWQMPHFLSLAWRYKDEYASAGYKMLPSVEPDGISTGRQSLAFAILTVAASLLIPFLIPVTTFFIVCTALTGIWFIGRAYTFSAHRDNITARRLFKASIWYIPIIFVLLVAERFIG